MPLEVNAQFNQFVQFAEQQMQAGKATAKAQVGDAEKGKVHALMALLNQKTAMAAMNAEPLALDPHGRDNQLTVAGDPSPEFTICFAEDGSLKVDCRLVASDNDAVTCRTGYKITVA